MLETLESFVVFTPMTMVGFLAIVLSVTFWVWLLWMICEAARAIGAEVTAVIEARREGKDN